MRGGRGREGGGLQRLGESDQPKYRANWFLGAGGGGWGILSSLLLQCKGSQRPLM
jgi:hypothetical protein